MKSAITIDFAPLLSGPLLYGIIGAIALLFIASLFVYRRGTLPRALCAAAFMLLFLNPSIVEEKREPVSDVAVIAVDRSPSQKIGKRLARTDAALETLKKKLAAVPGLDVRIVDSTAGETGLARETRLFSKIDEALADIPAGRRAGVILLTDGQIHDAPQDSQRLADYGPVHALLSGEKHERDRRLALLEAPSYGIVGQKVTLRYRIEDNDPGSEDHAAITIKQDNAQPRTDMVPVNEDRTLEIDIAHAGQNIVDIEIAAAKDEITAANNRLPVIVNGVRDRLRVLLVSGQPHAGGRTWRNLLTSDPAVDLVHFTILREPDKVDLTPQNDLSLIAFPFQELFETKLYDFDLIIFDRYRLNRILPNFYFGNIAKYVKEGGALLEASGPDFANENSIYATDLSQVFPAFPTGQVIERRFKPALTDTGKRHPVTQDLRWPGEKDGVPGWGSWLRQVAVSPSRGETLMSGADSLPLLVLDHAGKGRVAQLASDQIWLWSRGFEGGGPQTELLRRLAHWLMKEPDLEENALDISVDGSTLVIKRRSLTDDPVKAVVTAPDGTKQDIIMADEGKGWLESRLPAEQLGVYTVNDGTQERFAIAGDINPPELTGVRTTAEKLAPLVKESKGSIVWLNDTPAPDARLLPPERNYAGSGWIGLRANRGFTVAGVNDRPFLPAWVYALLLLFLAIGCWWHEGKSKA